MTSRRPLLCANKAAASLGQMRQGTGRVFFRELMICAYLGRGLTYQSLQRFEEAAEDLRTVLTFSPTSALAYEDCGIARMTLGDNAGAAADFREAIRDAPEEELEYTWLAHACTGLGELDEAIAYLGKQIELTPSWGTMYGFRGQVHLYNGAFQDALKDLDQAVELEPQIWRHYLLRACTHWQLDNVDAAMADLEKAIRLKPDYAIAYCYRALVRAEAGDLDAAIKDMDQTSEIHFRCQYPPWGETNHLDHVAWFLVACTDARLRQPDRALELARQLILRTCEHPRFLTALGAAQYRTGDLAAARQTLEGIAKPRHFRRGRAALFLAMALHRLGHVQQAQSWYDEGTQWINSRRGVLKQDRCLQLEAAELIGVDEPEE